MSESAPAQTLWTLPRVVIAVLAACVGFSLGATSANEVSRSYSNLRARIAPVASPPPGHSVIGTREFQARRQAVARTPR